ncbi:MAG: hypothetical protein WCQ50_16405, partial [Spirochaetota bacterium]
VPPDLVAKLGGLVGKLPFLPKKKSAPKGGAEPFDSLEDGSPDADESLNANALGPHISGDSEKTKVDFRGLLASLVSNKLVVGFIAAALFVGIAVAVASLVSQAEPPKLVVAPIAITAEGRAAAARFMLPPDPALDLAPPVEREPRSPYTDEDIKRLAPTHDPRFLSAIERRNDEAVGILFGTVR